MLPGDASLPHVPVNRRGNDRQVGPVGGIKGLDRVDVRNAPVGFHFFQDGPSRSGINGTQMLNAEWMGAQPGVAYAYLWGSPIEAVTRCGTIGFDTFSAVAPGCGRGVIAPASMKPNPARASASTTSAFLS